MLGLPASVCIGERNHQVERHNTRLERRLPLIKAATLVIWGEQDRLLPRSYANIVAGALGAGTEIRIIAGAGHLAELDEPDAVAAAILDFMG